MSLPRERLTALLTDSAFTSVELVIAPPGYGKTTVLRDYASADTGAVFVALPEGADLEAFVRTVIAAAVPTALHSVGAVFEKTDETNVEQRAGDWLVSRLRSFDGTLIVDDLHRAASDERVAQVLVAAIAATHGRMRWVVASREAPRFPMGSWIARGWMGLPITAEDLSFTIDEAVELAALLDVRTSFDDISEIVKDTVGWPIGVRLAFSLVARKRALGQTRVQTREALFALINDEIWRPLEENLRELIAAAALIEVPAIETLSAAGFPGVRSSMTQIFARVPFIQPIDDDAFAVHDLFREFVTSQTSGRAADQSAVAMRMGTALVVGGNPAEGLRLLIRTADVASVRETLADHAFDLLETGQRSTVQAAITFLSENSLDDDGTVLAIRAAFANSDGSAVNAANLYVRALKRNLPSKMRCEVLHRLAMSYLSRGDVDAALQLLLPASEDVAFTTSERLVIRALCGLARAMNGESSGVIESIHEVDSAMTSVATGTQARILQRLAVTAYYVGDFETAERLAQRAALLAIELSMDTLAALCYGTLYSIAGHVDSNTRRARQFLRDQAAAAERSANTALRVFALRADFVFAAINAETERAQSIDVMLAKLVDARTYRDSFAMRTSHALLHIANGNLKKAEAPLIAASADMSPAEKAFRDALLVLLMLARGERAEATQALERGLLTEAAVDEFSRVRVNCAHAFRAVAFWMLDRPLQARRSLGFDVSGMPQHYRILVESLRTLTEQRHPLPDRNAAAAICRDLEDADFGAYAALVRRLVERDANEVALSSTEIETLRVFDRHGGRAVDVAKALGKSRYTVQNQIQSAIKKIGCSGRAEALAYARQRGWLDSTDG